MTSDALLKQVRVKTNQPKHPDINVSGFSWYKPKKLKKQIMETVNATTTATPKTTMTFEQYVDWKTTKWCEEKIINPSTDLDIEINNMIDLNHRLNCMMEFNRMFVRDGKFGRNVTLIAKSNSVKMFPMNDNQIYYADEKINEQNIGLKLLLNLRMKKIIG